METSKKNRYLMWAVVFLLASNATMAIMFVSHKIQDSHLPLQTNESTINLPIEQRTRFFREQLNLSAQQVNQFREFTQSYNRSANEITSRLETLRMGMIEEMGKNGPDKQKLDSITVAIGNLHTKLKAITIDYYLKMKNECTPDQRNKLNEIFVSTLKQSENVKLPGRQGRYGWNKHRYGKN